MQEHVLNAVQDLSARHIENEEWFAHAMAHLSAGVPWVVISGLSHLQIPYPVVQTAKEAK